MTRAVGAAVATLVAVFALVCGPASAEGWHVGHAVDHGKTVFFDDVTVAPDETVEGNLNVVFGNATVEGTVHGDVNTIFGSCDIRDGAAVDGRLNCSNAAAQAVLPWVASSAGFSRGFAEQDRQLWTRLASSAIVVLVFLVFPLRMRLALDRVERHPGVAAAVGTLAMIAVLPVAIVLLLSLVGIPLIALEIAAVFAGVWLGTGAVALLVGRRLCELVLPTATPSPLLALVMGLVVVSAAEIVPVVGWIVTALVWLVGLGAAILAFVPSGTFGRTTRWPIGGPPMNRTA